MSVEIADLRVGTTVAGKYRIDRVLGSGGMGIVYAGEHVALSRPVAVKFLHPHLATNAKVVARFFAEAQAAAQLRHPNVVDVIDVGRSEDGAAYMVLELLSGESLSTTLRRVGRLSPGDTCRLILPVLEALELAHARGIVHRDLKPENIFVARSPTGALVPKVLDFGIAKLIDAGDVRATDTGLIVGTPTHLAPERARGSREIGGYTDVWSIGIVLYECLTGRHPYDMPESATPTSVLVTIVTDDPAPLAKHLPRVPRDLAECVDRALAKDWTKRWQHAGELRVALARAAARLSPTFDDATAPAGPEHLKAAMAASKAASPGATDTSTTIVTAPPSRGLRAWMWIAAAVALVSSLGIAVWALGRRDEVQAVPLEVPDEPTPVATPTPPTPPAAPAIAPPVPTPAIVEADPPREPEPLREREPRAPADPPRVRHPRTGTRTTTTETEPRRTTPPRAGQVSVDQF